MKTQEVAEKLGAIIYVRLRRDAKELYHDLDGKVMMPQIKSALKILVEQKLAIIEEDHEKVEKYRLTKIGQAAFKGKWGENTPDTVSNETVGTKEETTQVAQEDESTADNEKEEEKPLKPVGRDLTKYSFNGLVDLSKGRLALAVIRHIAEANPKVKLKDLVEYYPDTLVPPYGVIKPKKEALEISKGRPRFFIKQEEYVKLADGEVCVSNQWTTDRINEFIAITKKQYGLKVKTQ